MENKNVKWHKMTAQVAVAQLYTNAACGLSRKAARSRCRKLGPNTLFDSKKSGWMAVWKPILTDPSVLLFLFSIVLSLFFSSTASFLATLVIFVCVFISAFRLTGKIVLSHQTVSLYRVPTVFVLREGKVFELSARQIVPGDILLLQKGDIVPADCRVLETDGVLCTRLYYRDGTGKRTALEQFKRAETVYPYESRVVAPNCENILYGKSEITQGNVRALVVEIGEHTAMGAMQHKGTLAQEEYTALKKSLSGIVPYIRAFSLLFFVLLIPMTVIGLLTAPKEYDVMRTFLPIGVLCGMCSQAFLLLCFGSVLTDGYLQCVRTKSNHRSVPRSIATIDKLATVTDLIVLGRCASSDGMMHLHRVALGGGEIDLTDADSQTYLSSLCEAYELLFSAPSATPATAQQLCSLRDLENPILREELRKISQYDLDILDIRLKRAAAYYEADRIVLDVLFKDGELRYCFTDRNKILYSCTGYEADGRIYPLAPEQRQNLFDFIDSVISDGGTPTIVVRQKGNQTVLLGILSCREQMQPILPSALEALAESGVRVSFFLDEDDEAGLAYVKAANLPDSVCRASMMENEQECLNWFEHCRVFLGFSEKQIRSMIAFYQKKGRRFAVLGSDMETQSIQNVAFLRIACDPLLRDAKRSTGELEVSIPAESGFFDKEYCRSLSAQADLLLPRANENSGGVPSFLHAVSTSRAVRFRMQLWLKYIVIVFALRLTMIFFGACFGVGLISGSQLLWGSFVFDFLALYWVLHAEIPKNSLKKRYDFDAPYIEKIIGEKQNYLPPAMTAFVLCLFVAIFTWIGWITRADAVTLLFYSTLFIQTLVFCRIVLSYGLRLEWKKDLPYAAFVYVPFLLIFGLTFLLPILQTAFECSSFSLLSALMLPLGPVLYLVSYKIAPKVKFRQKTTNK